MEISWQGCCISVDRYGKAGMLTRPGLDARRPVRSGGRNCGMSTDRTSVVTARMAPKAVNIL